MRVDFSRLLCTPNLLKQRQMVEERRVAGIRKLVLAGLSGKRQEVRRELLPVNLPQLIPQHVKEKRVVR